MRNINILQSTSEETEYIRNKLIEFNSKNVLNGRYEEVNLCIKNDQDVIIAGLNSVVCWNWMEIDILWVNDDYRKQGIGKRLIEEAEKIARSMNCTFIKLNTFSFQAPEFYKKYGYKVIAVIENAPYDNKHYYLMKELF